MRDLDDRLARGDGRELEPEVLEVALLWCRSVGLGVEGAVVEHRRGTPLVGRAAVAAASVEGDEDGRLLESAERLLSSVVSEKRRECRHGKTHVLLELDGEECALIDVRVRRGSLDVQALGEGAGGEGRDDEDSLHDCTK